VGEDRLRLFVAADLPPPARAACARWRDEALVRAPELRPVADDALHVTLSFLGGRPAADVDGLARALEAVAAPARGLVLGGPRWLPARRPKVLALDLADPGGELARLRAAVVAAVADPESRRFLPHVTVARVRARERGRRTPLDPPPALGFAAAALTLYSSRTAAGGARYEALWRAELADPPVRTRR
jgi:RNA 2',3'-cyclic 3'-phosphodiesterase